MKQMGHSAPTMQEYENGILPYTHTKCLPQLNGWHENQKFDAWIIDEAAGLSR
jgi:hypothetical protein